MREFTNKEKELIKLLVKYRLTNDYKNLDTAKFVKNYIGVNVIRYSSQEITIYIPSKRVEKIKTSTPLTLKFEGKEHNLGNSILGVSNNEIDFHSYYKLADIVNLLRDLERNQLVLISRIDKENIEEPQYYYEGNNTTHVFDETGKYPILKNKDTGESIELIYAKFTGSIAELFKKYGSGVIFPLESLIDLVNHNFVSLEERNHRDQMKKLTISLRISIAAVIVSVLIPTILHFCSKPTKIDETQFEQYINSIKTEYPSTIKVESSDTLKIETIKNTVIK